MNAASYWFVVVDNQTGTFLNAQMANNSNNYDDAVIKFERKFPIYTVLEGGEGIENRPEAFVNLPYVS
ncbi:hypothetical protein [Bacillus sp. FJAT-29937]|uniref:hypothetical protein n=1 Tax=Bacillus sp. FJAT-29937 TaxID=1720553 RepID=UPI0008329949|nr:hypothetical protein [Bacillus sp. FJAT-29937]